MLVHRTVCTHAYVRVRLKRTKACSLRDLCKRGCHWPLPNGEGLVRSKASSRASLAVVMRGGSAFINPHQRATYIHGTAAVQR